jgi:hypothetical protein
MAVAVPMVLAAFVVLAARAALLVPVDGGLAVFMCQL